MDQDLEAQRCLGLEDLVTVKRPTTRSCFICSIVCGLPSMVGLIVLLSSITSLSPEEQLVLVTDAGVGKEVVNGPATTMTRPFQSKEVRHATRLSPQEYALVKNTRTGLLRNEVGPMLLFLEAWDELVEVRRKVVLQAREYTRLVDSFTGLVHVEIGPQRIVPGIYEAAPKSIQRATPVTSTEFLVVLNRTSGRKRCVREEGFFIPGPFEEVVEVRNATILKQKEYAVVRDSLSGEYRHEEGAKLLFIGAYDEVVKVMPKIVLQKQEYLRLLDHFTGYARVVVGPVLMVPQPSEDGPGGIQHNISKAIIIGSTTSVILLNKTSGKKYEVRTEGMFVPGPYEDVLEVRRATVLKSQEYAVVKNELTGKYVHYAGPQQLFVGPYEELTRVVPKVVLQKQEYVRLVDRRTGEENIVKGPRAVVPEPAQCEKDYLSNCRLNVTQATVMKADVAVLTLNKTTGVKQIVRADAGGIFTPVPYQEILEVRKATVLKSQEYAVVKNDMTGKYLHYAGPQLLFVGPYEQLLRVLPKLVLQKQDYVRLVDRQTGEEDIVKGPLAVVPEPTQCEKDYVNGCILSISQAIVMKADVSVLTLNRTSGVKRIVRADTGGIFTPVPYEEVLEVRKATVLKQQEYAVVKNNMNGSFRHVEGPTLLHLGAYEELIRATLKVVLHKFEYIRLVNELTGIERVVEGPQVVVPDPSEVSLKDGKSSKVHHEMMQQSTLVDRDHALLLLNQATGQQRLVTTEGMWTPAPYEHFVEKRPLLRVMANEAVIVRNYEGQLTIYDGTAGGAGTAFFLPARSQVLSMTWSVYGMPGSDGKATVTQQSISMIDMRIQRTFFSYVVRTNDNVQLLLMGTIFWRVANVTKMILGTSDPSGDVWHHCRSSFMQAVTNTSFDSFMGSFNGLAKKAYERDVADGFYTERGVALLSMEVTRFEAVDAETKETLQTINKETTNQITLLKKQEGENAVRAAKMRSDIALEEEQTQSELRLEGHKTSLIRTKMGNNLMQKKAEAEGEAQPFAQHAKSFISALNETGVSISNGVGLYHELRQAEHHNTDTRNLAGGKATLFLTSQDVKLNVRDLNLGQEGFNSTKDNHDL